MLVPFNRERICEDLSQLLLALNTLGKVEVLYSEFPDESDEAKTFFDSIDDYHREIFDCAWSEYRAALRRLSAMLNDGDIDMLDCDWSTRRTLKHVWDWLVKCECEKPEFVPSGRQELALPAVMWGFVGQQHLNNLSGKPRESSETAPVPPKYIPPDCPHCGKKMKVRSTRNEMRYIACPDCDITIKKSK